MTLDEYIIRDRDATFILRVKGNSMSNAGILEGDMIIVEKGRIPKSGDIVVAKVDGEFCMKYFRDIVSKKDVLVEAIVIGVIRKYTS